VIHAHGHFLNGCGGGGSGLGLGFRAFRHGVGAGGKLAGGGDELLGVANYRLHGVRQIPAHGFHGLEQLVQLVLGLDRQANGGGQITPRHPAQGILGLFHLGADTVGDHARQHQPGYQADGAGQTQDQIGAPVFSFRLFLGFRHALLLEVLALLQGLDEGMVRRHEVVIEIGQAAGLIPGLDQFQQGGVFAGQGVAGGIDFRQGRLFLFLRDQGLELFLGGPVLLPDVGHGLEVLAGGLGISRQDGPGEIAAHFQGPGVHGGGQLDAHIALLHDFIQGAHQTGKL